MNLFDELTLSETWLLGGLLALMALHLGAAARSRDPVSWFAPPVMVCLVFSYYCILGPLQALSTGEWYDRGVNLRDSFQWGWAGALVALASFGVGYSLWPQRVPLARRHGHFDAERISRLGQRLNSAGFTLFALVMGPRVVALLNPFATYTSSYRETGVNFGPFHNYLVYGLNLLIPGTLLMAAGWLSRRRNPFPVVMWLLVALGVFTAIGFRYRLVILLGPLAMLWYVARQRRPQLWVLGAVAAGLILLAGFVGASRNYGRGLDTSRVENFTGGDYYAAGLRESTVFLTTGGVIRHTPEHYPFVGLAPITSTLLFPVPRALYAGKGSAEYLTEATAVVYRSDDRNSGTAILNFAEYYLMAGWPSLIAGYLLFGWLYRRLWNWFLGRRLEPLAQVLYVCTIGYMYVVISRGYLPQVTMLFCFTVLPLFLLYRYTHHPVTAKPAVRLARPTLHQQ